MAGLLLTIAAAAFILEHARVPLAGAYESLLMLLWTAAVLIYAVRRTAPSRPELLTAGLMLGILSAWLTFGNLTPNHDFFLYASGWVQAFFFFRLLAAGVMLTTGLAQAAGTFNKSLFMAGFLLFLVSEFTGSVWCFRVWGDFWHWSANFFQSALVFFLMMLTLHLPPRWLRQKPRSGRWPALLRLASPFLIIVLLLF